MKFYFFALVFNLLIILIMGFYFFSGNQPKPTAFRKTSCLTASAPRLDDYSQLLLRRVQQKQKVRIQDPDPEIWARFKGKTLVMTLAATWCGWCQAELIHYDGVRKKNDWPGDKLAYVHLIVPSSRQTLDQLIAWLKDERRGGRDNRPISLEGVTYLVSTKHFDQIQDLKSLDQNLLFPGLKGTPYSLVFDRFGRLRFRGHYTGKHDSATQDFDQHFANIKFIAEGGCDQKS